MGSKSLELSLVAVTPTRTILSSIDTEVYTPNASIPQRRKSFGPELVPVGTNDDFAANLSRHLDYFQNLRVTSGFAANQSYGISRRPLFRLRKRGCYVGYGHKRARAITARQTTTVRHAYSKRWTCGNTPR